MVELVGMHEYRCNNYEATSELSVGVNLKEQTYATNGVELPTGEDDFGLSSFKKRE